VEQSGFGGQYEARMSSEHCGISADLCRFRVQKHKSCRARRPCILPSIADIMAEVVSRPTAPSDIEYHGDHPPIVINPLVRHRDFIRQLFTPRIDPKHHDNDRTCQSATRQQ